MEFNPCLISCLHDFSVPSLVSPHSLLIIKARRSWSRTLWYCQKSASILFSRPSAPLFHALLIQIHLPYNLLNSSSFSTPQRIHTWVSQRNNRPLLLAHVPPNRRDSSHHHRPHATHNDGVKVRRLVDRRPSEVAQRLLEEARGRGSAGHGVYMEGCEVVCGGELSW